MSIPKLLLKSFTNCTGNFKFVKSVSMRFLKAFIFNSVFICLISCQAIAQGPGDPGCDPLDPYCPIDGGLSLLIAAAVGVGAKKAYDAKKRDSSSTL